MEWAKKSVLGGFKSCVESEATHSVVEIEEYNDLVNQIKKTRIDNSYYKTALCNSEKKRKEDEELIKKQKKKINEMVRYIQITKKTHTDVSKLTYDNDRLRVTIKHLQEESDAARHLNQNLRRICRERANQERNIRPKKKHDGYIVLSSQEWRITLPDGTRKTVWKSILQTPYDSSIPFDIIRNDIYMDIKNKVIIDLGCDDINEPEKNGVYFATKGNRLFQWSSHIADFRTGLWTIMILTSEAITVPAERRRHTYGNQRKNK